MYIAKKYFVLGKNFYKPGDWVEQKDINEAQWRNLADAGAIETHVDEVLATLDDGSGLGFAEEGGEAPEEMKGQDGESDAFEGMELPDVAVVEAAPAGRKSQKGAKK